MAKITNYLFVKRKNGEISSLFDFREKTSEEFSLSGLRCEDSQHIITSSVKEINDTEVKTLSGSTYEVLEINCDYLDFLNAIDCNIPIMHNWHITGNTKDGYYISGILENKIVNNLKVVRQIGNSLIVYDNNSEEKEIFIDWYSIDKNYLPTLFVTETLKGTDIKSSDFIKFANDKCKIKFKIMNK